MRMRLLPLRWRKGPGTSSPRDQGNRAPTHPTTDRKTGQEKGRAGSRTRTGSRRKSGTGVRWNRGGLCYFLRTKSVLGYE
jgi:hypothetical protein